jgi:hypothetical protein
MLHGALTAAVLATILLSAPSAASQAPPPTTTIDLGLGRTTGRFVVRLPETISAERCEVQTFQTGAFGGLSGGVPPDLEANTIAIRTGSHDKPARTLKVVVWCPGHAVALIDEPALEKSSGSATVALAPLPSVEIRAKVLPAPDGRNLTGLHARVFYTAYWISA